MVMPTQPALRLLVVDDDDDLRVFLQDLLSEEGYLVDTSSTMAEALAAIDSHVYHLIVSDLLAHSIDDPLRSAIEIREAGGPTPVMTLTGWNVTADEVARAGLARLVPKPFDITDLLGAIAECSRTRLSPLHQRWAVIASEYCAALVAHDVGALAALCADNVRFVAISEAGPGVAAAVRGRAPYLAHLESYLTQAPDMRFDEYAIYPLPDGIALRSVISWQSSEPQAGRAHVMSSITFQFADQLISQLTIHTHRSHHASLQTQSTFLSAGQDI